MYPASTLSFELVALAVSVGRVRPARRLKSLLFADFTKNEMYVRVIRHHNETCGWHVRAGRVKHADLDLAVDCSGPQDARRRQGGRRSWGIGGRRARARKIHEKR